MFERNEIKIKFSKNDLEWISLLCQTLTSYTIVEILANKHQVDADQFIPILETVKLLDTFDNGLIVSFQLHQPECLFVYDDTFSAESLTCWASTHAEAAKLFSEKYKTDIEANQVVKLMEPFN